MPTSRLCVAAFAGALVFFTLCHGIVRESAEAWRVLIALAPLLLIVTWWMIDRAALERRIRRLEARSAIADERRISARTDLTETEHKLHRMETRIDEFEKSTNRVETRDEMDSHGTTIKNRTSCASDR
jgi:hypothetical protein